MLTAQTAANATLLAGAAQPEANPSPNPTYLDANPNPDPNQVRRRRRPSLCTDVT